VKIEERFKGRNRVRWRRGLIIIFKGRNRVRWRRGLIIMCLTAKDKD